MSDFEYSVDALNTKPLFYGARFTIYVEGDDDVLFWNTIFSTIENCKFHIEPLGGSNELDEYINKIQSNELEAIAARDADYLAYTNKKVMHDRVVYTYGYSIENSLYTADSIHALTKLWCKDLGLKEDACLNWLNTFSNKIRTLLAIDILNAATGTGVFRSFAIIALNSWKARHHPNLCLNKIEVKINEIRNYFS